NGGGPPSGYCASAGSTTVDEWIQRVQVGTIDNNSGANNGYADFTNLQTNVAQGSSVNITLTAAWAGTLYNEGFAVWIDYNRDGDFNDSGELAIASGSASTTSPISGSFTIPATAQTGLTRMRITMQYNVVPSDPCASFQFGEVEDYLVNIVPGSSNPNLNQTVLTSLMHSQYDPEGVKDVIAQSHPNPTQNVVEVKVRADKGSSVKMLMTDVNGIGLVSKERISETGEVKQKFDLSTLSKGLYIIQVWTPRGHKALKVIKE
ncbi:MAG: GEVED domain-containing protein, partial [Bacteroidota bacterium]